MDELKAEIEQLNDANNELEAENASLQQKIVVLEGEKSDLEMEVTDLEETVSNISAQLNQAKLEAQGYLTDSNQRNSIIESKLAEIDDLNAQIESLTMQNNDLTQNLSDAEVEISVLNNQIYLLTRSLEEEFPTIVLQGYTAGKALSGTWKTSETGITQTDTKQYFAKYSIPLTQDYDEVLYGFTAKGSDTKKLGLGLHILVSDSIVGNGYGLGDSYLVWITKDSKYHKYVSDAIYVQLYKSYDDIKMLELASAGVPESILTTIKVEVKYTVTNLSVYVDDTLRFSYDIPDAEKKTGTELALRTMGGPIEFSDVYVRTK
jgi:cell division protein FtsB